MMMAESSIKCYNWKNITIKKETEIYGKNSNDDNKEYFTSSYNGN